VLYFDKTKHTRFYRVFCLLNIIEKTLLNQIIEPYYLRVYNKWSLTIRYKLPTKTVLFFFDAKKEPKKLLGDCEFPQTPERFIVVFI